MCHSMSGSRDEYRTPAEKDKTPFYGRLEEANLPDVLRVDYARVWEEDLGGRKGPQVTLTARPGTYKEGGTGCL